MDFGAWAQTLNVNVMGPLRVVQALIGNLRRSKEPKIATVSSQMGALNLKGGGSYAYRSSKAAVNKIMQTLAGELAGEKITVAVFHPGWVKTDMGGSGADITVEESAGGIFNTISKLTPSDTGRFFKWNGEVHAW
jgi:NAD(P)-dependent dehydrogenase (short-subunit alcohol dehydrogenase family)